MANPPPALTPLEQGIATARSNGFSQQEIHDAIAQRWQKASDQGFSDAEIASRLGYKAQDTSNAQMAANAKATYQANPPQAQSTTNPWELFIAGMKASSGGVLTGQSDNAKTMAQGTGFWGKLAYGLGGGVGDLPAGLAGGTAGAVVGAVGGSETGPGAVFTSAAATGAGAMALPEYIKQQHADEIRNGQYRSTEDFAVRYGQVLWHTAQMGTVGALTGGTGKYVGVGAEVAGYGVAQRTILQSGAEMAALTAGTMAINGKLMSKEDLIDSAILMATAHGAAKLTSATAPVLAAAKENLAQNWVHTGESPTDAATRTMNDMPARQAFSIPSDAPPRITTPASTQVKSTGYVLPKIPGNFEAAGAWMLKQEGGLTSDTGGVTKYGISSNAHPGLDVKNISQTDALNIYHSDYWVPMKIDGLPDNMKLPVFDAAINEGVAKAKEMLEKSGNDPQAFQALREEHYRSLAESNPGKYGQFLPTWLRRIGSPNEPGALNIGAGRQMMQDMNMGEPPSEADAQALGSNLLDEIRKVASDFAQDESGALGKQREATKTEQNPEGELTPEEEVASHFAGVTKPPSFSELLAKGSHDLYLEMMNPDHPLGRLVDAAREGGSLEDARNPLFLQRAAEASDNTSQYMLEKGMLDTKGNVIGPGLRTILEPFEGETGANTFWTYAGARWAAEKAEQGKETGIPLDSALKVIQNGHAKYGDAFNQLVDFQNKTLTYLRDAGVLSEAAHDAAIEANKARIPGYRVIEELHPREGGKVGGGTNPRNPIRTFEGSDLQVQNVHESLIKDTFLRISLANHNLLNQAAADAALPLGLARVEGEGAVHLPLNVEDLESKLDPDMDATVAQLTGKALKEDEVPVLRNGQMQKVVFSDPDLAPLLRGMNSVQQGMWQKMVGAVANFQRSMIVLNPAFPLHILGYDIPFQFITKPGFRNTIAQAITGIGHTFGESKVWDQWMRQGAPDRIFDGLSKSGYLKDVMKGDQDPAFMEGTFNLIKTPYDAMKWWSMKMAQVMPVGRFAQGLKAGESQEALAYAASEAPFHRSGAMGPQAKAINSGVPFFTAYLNGMEKTARALAGFSRPGEGEPGWDPKLMTQTWAKAAAVITIPIVLNELQNKDKEWYKAVPDYVKDNAFVFHMGDDWEATGAKDEVGNPVMVAHGTTLVYKYPPLLSLIFGAIPRRLVSQFMEDNPSAWEGFHKSIAPSLLPPGGMYPSAFLPFLEHAANYSYFKERPLVPDSVGHALPTQEKYTPYSTSTAKALSRFVNDLPLLKSAGLSPPVIDNYIDSWSGTLGTAATHVVDMALQASGAGRQNLPAPHLEDTPLLSSFLARYPNASAQPIRDFDDQFQKFSEVHDRLSLALKENDFQRFQQIIAENPGIAGAKKLTMPKDTALPSNLEDYANAYGSAAKSIPQTTFQWLEAAKAVQNEQKMVKYINSLPGRANSDNPNAAYASPNDKRQLLDQHYATMQVMAERANDLAKQAGIQ
jgi:hypothetical protein